MQHVKCVFDTLSITNLRQLINNYKNEIFKNGMPDIYDFLMILNINSVSVNCH